MEAVTLKPNHPKQMQIMVGKCRVGYVCFGERKPINFLPPKVTKIKLTDDERLEVAMKVREQMRTLNAERENKSAKLADLTSSNFESNSPSEESEENGTE